RQPPQPRPGRGAARLRRGARPPPDRRRRPDPRALALRALRTDPALRPALRHPAAGAPRRRAGRHRRRHQPRQPPGGCRHRLRLRGGERRGARRHHPARRRRLGRPDALARADAARHEPRLFLGRGRQEVPLALSGADGAMSPGPSRGDGATPALPLVAIVLALAFGCNFIGRGIAETWAVFLLPIEAEFGFARSEVTSVYSIYLVVAGLAAPFSGMAFDRFGPRFCYLVGMACVGLGTFAAGWAQARWHFVLANGLTVGIGASLIGMVPASVMIGRWFHAGLGRAVAFAYAGFGTGILLLVPLSQFLIEWIGWRNAYHALGAGLTVVGLGLLALPWRRIAAG